MSAIKYLAFAATAFLAFAAGASSHREAPFIAMHPAVDGTDLYMFDSYETGRSGFVTILANYNPLQDPFGGPNYFALDPDALYEINIDNTGDGVEDLTFQFQFQNSFANQSVNGATSGAAVNVAVPLIDVPPLASKPTVNNPAGTNRSENYTVNLVRGGSRSGKTTPVINPVSSTPAFIKPLDNIGINTFTTIGKTPYTSYIAPFIYSGVTVPGCSAADANQARVFVGQRREGFFVNLGEVFDLVNFTPVVGAVSAPNAVGNKNITTIALELPIDCLTADGKPAGTTADPVIGAWTVSSLRQARVQNPNPQGPVTGSNASGGSAAGPEAVGGAWTQVSRLSSPLVNELVIGLPDKDKFNASSPVNDATTNGFANYVLYPSLPVLLNVLFKTDANIPATPRYDLVQAFLSGVPGVNNPSPIAPPIGPTTNGMNTAAPATPVLAEMVRLNVVAGAPKPAAAQNTLGALQCFTVGLTSPLCDTAGFPNGRRPGDDVVDIELRVVEGELLGANDPNLSNGVPLAYTDGVTTYAANGALTSNATSYLPAFPYLNTPIPGSPNGPIGPNSPTTQTSNGLPVDGATP